MAAAASFLHAAESVMLRPALQGAACFNIFEAVQFGADETRHTQVLAWLLSAEQTHGHGRLFFDAMLTAAGIELVEECKSSYTVRAEYGGREAITDIVAYSKNAYVIAIENKINATEGDDQIAREQRDMDHLAEVMHIPEKNRFGIFLTHDGRPPTTGPKNRRWTSLSHEKLADALAATNGLIRDAKLSAFVADLCEYMRTWRSAE